MLSPRSQRTTNPRKRKQVMVQVMEDLHPLVPQHSGPPAAVLGRFFEVENGSCPKTGTLNDAWSSGFMSFGFRSGGC